MTCGLHNSMKTEPNIITGLMHHIIFNKNGPLPPKIKRIRPYTDVFSGEQGWIKTLQECVQFQGSPSATWDAIKKDHVHRSCCDVSCVFHAVVKATGSHFIWNLEYICVKVWLSFYCQVKILSVKTIWIYLVIIFAGPRLLSNPVYTCYLPVSCCSNDRKAELLRPVGREQEIIINKVQITIL